MAITWRNRTTPAAVLACTVGILSVPAAFAQQEITRGAVIAATCYTCHGTNGVSTGNMPSINEISTERMIGILNGFRTGTRAATVMGRHASGYTDDEIREVAQYFGNLQTRGK
jgi:cytochrome subunit of sulfide dehydrogenase